MKFGKDFTSQMVPGWKEYYLDYKYLKSLLKKPIPITTNGDDKATMANPQESDGLSSTTSPIVEAEGEENEIIFFKKLYAEFEKVDKFYRTKVDEALKEASALNGQMDALIVLRIKVEKKHCASDVAATGKVHTDITNKNEIRRARSFRDMEEKKEILDNVKINITNGTPYSTVKCFHKIFEEKELNLSKQDLKTVEGQLEHAFIDFYEKLQLLNKYSSLNRLAIYEILKKYNKVHISLGNISQYYLGIVESSSIGKEEESKVHKLMERVEDTFIKHFPNSIHRKQLNVSRVKLKTGGHGATFSLGFFSGCTFALFVALILLIHLRKLMKKEGYDQYMNNMFPLYSLFGFFVLHMIMYASNIYFWRIYRVNYSFIFGFKKGTEIGYKDVLLLGVCLATLALATVVANLRMEMNKRTNAYETLIEVLPLGLLTLVLLIACCPFNIIYRSSRYSLLYGLFRCVCAPLYKSSLHDWFLSDQITSQIQALRSLEFYICYYGWGDIKKRHNNCASVGVYKTFFFIVALIPYWSRVLQCFRHSILERDSIQGFNGLKHFTTIVAVLMRTAYAQEGGRVWWALAMISSVVAAVYCIYWDIVVDWGLLKRNSKNRWLRDELILPRKSVYYMVMVLNILLRLSWVQTLSVIRMKFLHKESLIAIIAILEILRRGIWNFFRLENEHLNLAGRYGASGSVPLPFKFKHSENEDQCK